VFKLVFLPALFLGMQTHHAQAFELFGRCFSESCEQQKAEEERERAPIDPKTYLVQFDVDAPGEIEDSIRGRSELWRQRDEPVAGSAGLLSRAKGDYKRILAGLYNEGYYGGAISITVNGREAAGIGPGTELPDNSNVMIQVEAGPLYVFGTFNIENQAPVPLPEDDQVQAPDTFTIEPGEAAKADRVRQAARLAVQEWRQLGHPKADIGEQSVTADHPNQILNVTLKVAPGPAAVYGVTRVEGTERMDPDFVVYMADLPPGQEYDPDDLERAEKRLDRLGVFSLRKVEGAEAIGPDGALPINITVDERKLRRIGIGATFSTTEGAGFEASWLHRNLFGQAESLRLEGEVNGLGETFDGDELDYRLGLTYTEPGTFSPDTDWITNIYGFREFNDTFDGEAVGASTSLRHRFSDRLTGSIGAFVEYSDFTDAFGSRELFTAGALGRLTYDGRDEELDPSKGIYADFEVRPFHEFELDNTAVRFEGELRGYQAFGEQDWSVLAARVKLGSLVGIERAQTPANYLFFAGGGGSVRGFDFNNIGVEEADGEIAGGRSLLEGSLEFRQRFDETWGGVIFADAGLVGEDSFIDFEEDVRVSVGAGVRYYTGIGPIRLDVAVPLNPQSGDPDFAIFAGIGQAF